MVSRVSVLPWQAISDTDWMAKLSLTIQPADIYQIDIRGAQVNGFEVFPHKIKVGCGKLSRVPVGFLGAKPLNLIPYSDVWEDVVGGFLQLDNQQAVALTIPLEFYATGNPPDVTGARRPS